MTNNRDCSSPIAWKLGVAAWKLHDDWHKWINFAESFNLDELHIDIGGGKRGTNIASPAILGEFKYQLRQSDITISCVTLNQLNDIGILHNINSALYAKGMQLAKTGVDTAVALSCHLVCVPSFRNSQIKSQTDLNVTAHFLGELSEYAKQSGTMLASENVLPVERAQQLLKKIDKNNFKLLFDSYNPVLFSQNPSTLLEELWPHWCNQIHIKSGAAGVMGNTPLGAGKGNAHAVLEVLYKLKFEGSLIFENNYMDGIDFQTDLQYLKTSISNLQELPR